MIKFESAEGYEELARVLKDAHDQASAGKGKERHSKGEPFHLQRMQGISDLIGTDGGMAYQVIKKVTEGMQFQEYDRFERELLGAINYLAGIIIYRKKRAGKLGEADSAGLQIATGHGYPEYIVFNHWLIKTYVRHIGVGAQQTFDGLTPEQIELVCLMLNDMDLNFGLVQWNVYQPAKKPGRSGLPNFILKDL